MTPCYHLFSIPHRFPPVIHRSPDESVDHSDPKLPNQIAATEKKERRKSLAVIVVHLESSFGLIWSHSSSLFSFFSPLIYIVFAAYTTQSTLDCQRHFHMV